MAADPATILASVEAVITKLLDTGGGVQSFQVSTANGGSEAVTYADLEKLFDRRDKLILEVQRASAAAAPGGMMNYGRRGRP